MNKKLLADLAQLIAYSLGGAGLLCATLFLLFHICLIFWSRDNFLPVLVSNVLGWVLGGVVVACAYMAYTDLVQILGGLRERVSSHLEGGETQHDAQDR